MAIDRIPGVGPTNAEIAAAVAAPSAATIAAAVAAPSASTIASAVAAPSSATIASAVAAAVPTTAGITSIVQANAGSPFGGTWTTLVSGAPASDVSTLTYSSLGGYRFLRIFFFPAYNESSQGEVALRLNGDVSTANYEFLQGGHWRPNNGSFMLPTWAGREISLIGMCGQGGFPPHESPSSSNAHVIDIINASSTTAHKVIRYSGGGTVAATNGGGFFWYNGNASYTPNLAITSVSFLTFNARFNTGTRIRILGAN